MRALRSLGRLAAIGVAAVVLHVSALAAQEPARVRVEVVGVEGPVLANVRTVMGIARAADDGAELAPSRVRQMHQQAEGEIRLALQPFGFYRPLIRSALTREGDGWLARYAIDPGPPTIVRTVDIAFEGEGAQDSAFLTVREEFPLAPGDTLRHLPYDLAKLRLLAIAADSGYLRAAFDTSVIVVDRAAATADVVLHFRTGPRFRFGDVRFEQSILDTGFLATRIPFERGEFFRQDKLFELQQNLGEDPYFSLVEVVPVPERARGDLVPIDVRLAPRPPQAYEAGLGYGTDTGPRGRVAARLRRLNRSGHHAEAELTVSAEQQSVSTKYLIPAFGHPTGVLTFLAGFAFLNSDSAQRSRTFLVGPRLSRRRFGWHESFSLAFQREAFEVGVDTGTTTLFVGGASWERTRTADDNRVFPMRGLRLRLDLQGGVRQLFSSATFGRVLASAKAIRSLGPRTRVIARAEAGRLFTGDGVFRTLPLTLRFFAGGDQSVRGYRYRGLGIEDEAGNVIGGPNLLTGSLEVDFRVLERWAVAAFTDLGNASSRFGAGLEQGVGAGIRWLSPIGLVRVDGAFPVSEPDAPFRIHLGIGPDL